MTEGPRWKEEAIRQWSADPCGAIDGPPFGSPEFFKAVEEERYGHYAPWMLDEMGFDRQNGRRVLEVGCGLGTDLASFARGGARAFGIDLTERHLRATARRLRIDGHPVRLVRADAERLPFRPESFDVVYSFGVLHHTPRTADAVGEVHRVLRPAGSAIVALYHRDSDVYWRSLVLGQGVLRGRFFREGYRRTLSRVERRVHSDAVPLVKVYSRRGAARLFARFGAVRTTVRHFAFAQMGAAGRSLGRLFARLEPLLERTIGWYVIVHAERGPRP